MPTPQTIRQHALVLTEAGVEIDQAVEQILEDCSHDLDSIVIARRSLSANRAIDGDPIVTLTMRYLDEIINRRLWA
jgi:hypothetical protein